MLLKSFRVSLATFYVTFYLKLHTIDNILYNIRASLGTTFFQMISIFSKEKIN
jgi:hypothetical protein